MIRKGNLRVLTKKDKILLASLTFSLIIILVLYSGKIHDSILEGYQNRNFTMYERLLTEPRVLVNYLSLLALPLPNRLSLTYDIVKSTSLFTPVTTFLSLIFLITLFNFAIKSIKKSPLFSFAVFWFFAGLTIESTFLPLEFMFEHRMYLPGIFLICFFVHFIIRRLYNNNKSLVIISLITVTILFSIMTSVRGQVWKDNLTLWSDVLRKYPNDPRAFCNVGTEYFKRGMWNEAEYNLKSGIDKWNKINTFPMNLAAAYNNLGQAQFKLGKLNDAEKSYLNGIKHKSDFATLHANLCLTRISIGNYSGALQSILDAIKYEPSSPDFYMYAASSYYLLNKYDDAIIYYNKSLALKPDNSAVYNAIGSIYKKKEDYKKAAESFKQAIYFDNGNQKFKENLKDIELILKQK